MTQFTVIGAGLAGLLAAAMLRDECDAVIEAQASIPNNHAALLRFRSSIVGDALNIPFRAVNVMKAVVPFSGNPVGDALSYSIKTNGNATLRSSISAQGKIEQRFIAPSDLIDRMQKKVVAPIKLKTTFKAKKTDDKKTISTIPMPLLMQLLGYDHKIDFGYVAGYTIQVDLKSTDVCATVYFPNPEIKPYRASITGNRLIVEYAEPNFTSDRIEAEVTELARHPKKIADELLNVLPHMGLKVRHASGVPEVRLQKYAKIRPIDDGARKRFILWASEHHNIYSLGRFATWRPSLLLDDVVNDVRVIQKIANGTNYEGKK